MAARPAAYYGPTLPMYEVVARINANNRQIPSLWARHSFEAYIKDEQGKSHFVNGDGNLMYRRPLDLRLIGKKDIIGTVFDIGSNGDRFWLHLKPDEINTIWWGHYRNLDKPGTVEIPIRPDLILEVLGVSEIDENFLKQPAPTMRFNNDADAYMLVWNVQGPDRWVAAREIWYDRQTFLPRLVLLFDENGRILLRAYLSKHQPVEIDGGQPRESWPKIATDYRLFFPDTGNRMSFELRDVALQSNGFPKDLSFRFPVIPEDTREIRVDENYE